MSGRFQIIYADPPWAYADKGCNGAAEAHYRTMSLDKICEMPISKLAAPDAVLFLWATYPMLREALKVIEAWGFIHKSIAFQWVKTYKPKEDGSSQPFFGLGRWTRGNTEPCLLATRGKPKRVAKDVGQLIFTTGNACEVCGSATPYTDWLKCERCHSEEVIVAPVTRHSAKPPEVRDRIVKLMGDVPRLELFARERVTGWHSWGDQLP